MVLLYVVLCGLVVLMCGVSVCGVVWWFCCLVLVYVVLCGGGGVGVWC